MASNKIRYRERLATTGAKVRRVIYLQYIEDLEKQGKTYWDLLAYLDHLHVKAVVSPIHDMDTFTSEDVLDWCSRHIDPETGDLDTHYLDSAPYVGKHKKPHCHVGIMTTAQMNAFQWSELMSGLVEVRPTMWDKMIDYSAFLRYCAHLDSPEKAQYSPFDVRGFGGVDLSDLLKDDKMERISTLSEVMEITAMRKYRYFNELADDAFKSKDIDFINCVVSKYGFFQAYLGGARQKKMDEKEARKEKEKSNGCSS